MFSFIRKFPFVNAVPKFVVPFINDYYNVKADGNCRYRLIAYFIYSDEKKWPTVRRDLLNEMNGRLRLYADIFGGEDRAQSSIVSLQHWEGDTNESKWMDVTDMAWVIANAYNVVCVSFSMSQNLTYLPLNATKDVQGPTRVITMVYLELAQHFIAV